MPNIITVILFFVYCYGLGLASTRFIERRDFETFVLRTGVGLATFIVLGVFFNALGIPLDWRIFLLASFLVPAGDLIAKTMQEKKIEPVTAFKYTDNHTILLILIFAFAIILYCGGPFAYPWLENDDSWAHAAGIKYITIEKNLSAPAGMLQYLNPYPPGYDLIFGVLHQTSPSLYWTLKFFNGLFVALSYLFFNFFARSLTNSKDKALLATFFLAVIPCYLSHFIWAHALVIALFFPAFMLLHKAFDDRRYIVPAGLVMAGILLTQPTQSIKFVILALILFLVTSIIRKRVQWPGVLAGALAVILSLMWWGPVLRPMAAGKAVMAKRSGSDVTAQVQKTGELKDELFNPHGGSATRAYALEDYLFIPEYNKINNPTGTGTVLFLLALAGILCVWRLARTGRKEEKIYPTTLLAWLVFVFLGMNSATFNLPVGLYAFRFWMLFAFIVAFLATETILAIAAFIERPAIRNTAVILLVLSVVFTSGHAKIRINTGIWPWGVYWHTDELGGYVWLRHNLEPNSKVFAFTDNFFVIGNDMRADFWRNDYRESFRDAFTMDLPKLYRRLKSHKYDYLIVGQREIRKFGEKSVNEKLAALEKDPSFELIHAAGNGARIYKLL